MPLTGSWTRCALALTLLASPVSLVAQQADPAQKLQQIEQQSTQEEKSYATKIDQLTQNVAALQLKVEKASTTDLKAAYENLTGRIKQLEDLNATHFEGSVASGRARYHTAREVMVIMLGNMDKLKFTFDLAASLTSFEGLANPWSSAVFQKHIADLSGKQRDNASYPFSALLGSNPYIAAAFSLASLFTSKLNRPQRENAFTSVACVLDFTSAASADARIMRTNIDAVNSAIASRKAATEQMFQTLSSGVGYGKDWTTYRQERAQLPTDPFEVATNKYFDKVATDNATTARAGLADPRELRDADYSVDQVRSSFQAYEELLGNVTSFLAGFETTVMKHRGKTCDAIDPNLPTKVESLMQEVQGARQNFKNGFLLDVPAKSRATLLGH